MSPSLELHLPGAETGRESRLLLARGCGVLFLCEAALVLLSLLLVHPGGSNDAALQGLVAVATVVGGTLCYWANRVPVWLLHAVIVLASALICLCVYFSGIAAGMYSSMFVWIVLMSAYFFSHRLAALHLGWLLAAYGMTLIALGDSAGFAPLTRWLLSAFVLVVATVVTSWLVAGLQREVRLRKEAQRKLRHLAHHDPLTGAANRRRLHEELARELARCTWHGQPLSVGLLDLDAFKSFNDEHGHIAGDALLTRATARWQALLPAPDLLARWGGDEFLVVLPECDWHQAESVVARLCSVVPEGQGCSAGVAEWDGAESVDALIERADRGLYEAKRVRHNNSRAPSRRVVCSEPSRG